MPRAYLRLDPAFYERKLLDQKYPPGAVAALIGCLCLAESQPLRGRFRDRRVLKVLLGSLARWVPLLVERGDLVEQDAFPRIYVDGWDEWQEGDWKVAERMHRLRVRTHGVTPIVTVPVTVPVTGSRIAEAVGGGGANGGGVGPSRPTTFMGYRPKTPEPERLPGEAVIPRHAGQHDNCGICDAAIGVRSIEDQQAESLADAIAKAKARSLPDANEKDR